MKTEEMFEIKEKMCKMYRSECVRCPLSLAKTGYGCMIYIKYEPEKAGDIITKWVDENIPKTNHEVFQNFMLRTFSDISLSTCEYNVPCLYDKNCEKCIEFWNSEYVNKI